MSADMIYCKKCKKEVESVLVTEYPRGPLGHASPPRPEAKFCPDCGRKLKQVADLKKEALFNLLARLSFLLIFGTIMALFVGVYYVIKTG